jgi:Tetratricopeptide repeat
MKTLPLKNISIFALTGFALLSCDLVKDVTYTVTPSPLEMHGDSVRVKIEGTFPAKGLNKKATVEFTPMLGYDALNTVTVIGEKGTGNGTTIAYKPGGVFTYEDVIVYKPDYEATQLTITGRVLIAGKEKLQIPSKNLAEGTIITPLLVNKDFKVATIKKENHSQTKEAVFTSQVKFLKGKSDFRASELEQDYLKNFQTWLLENKDNPKVTIKAIDVVGYASPEGEENKNNSLSTDRATTGKSTAIELAKKLGNTAAQAEIYSMLGRGEDYEGFKVELEKSSMNQDEKQLVIRVLEMYKDPVQRETEMRNMAKTFTYLDDNVFPKLRRAEIRVKYETIGLSDDEYKTVAVTTPEVLDAEQLMYSASLLTDPAQIDKIYSFVQSKYPDDYRAYNNEGVLFFNQGKYSEAKAKFDKAAELNNEDGIVKNNLAAIAGVNGDMKKAKQILSGASGAGIEGNYNKGIIKIVEGNYADAISNFSDNQTFNKSLAQVLNKDYDGAMKTLEASTDNNTAQGNYLKAIISARKEKADDCINFLKNAVDKDAAYKKKIARDKEFAKVALNENFKTVYK